MTAPITPELLRALLRGPCQVTHVERKCFPGGRTTPDHVVVSHRLILVLAGSLTYTVDERRRRLGAGDWLWVPAWSRRKWVSARDGCELSWCEFTTDPVTVPPGGHRVRPAPAAVAGRLAAMGELWARRDGWSDSLLEAEAKWLAAAFWRRAGDGSAVEKPGARHPEVRRAVAWLEAHHTEPDALERCYRGLALSPNHFRLLFRRQTGETVQAMLARLRLRRARYLATETALSVKEIAAECGYDDPLYFSQHYRRFWGRPPSADRGGATAA